MHDKLIQYTAQTSTQTAKPSYTADAILDHGVPDEEASIFPNLFTREALERKVREVLVTNKASTLGIAAPGSELAVEECPMGKVMIQNTRDRRDADERAGLGAGDGYA